MKMPYPSDIEWIVIDDADLYGQYRPSPHEITMSSARNGHFDTVARTLLHEMVHMLLYLEGKQYEKHNKNFLKYTYKIAEIYGFDPKEL